MKVTKPQLHSALIFARKALTHQLIDEEYFLKHKKQNVAKWWKECDINNPITHDFMRLNIAKDLVRKSERKIVKLKEALRILKVGCRGC